MFTPMRLSYGTIEMDTVRVNLAIFIATCLLFISGVLGVAGYGVIAVVLAAFFVPVTYWRWVYSISENKYAESVQKSSDPVTLPWSSTTAAASCYHKLGGCSDSELRLCLTNMFVELFCDENGNLDEHKSVSGADFVESASDRIHTMLHRAGELEVRSEERSE